MVNKPQLSTKLKSAARITTRIRNKKNQEVHDTPITPRTRKDEKALLETIRKIIKNEIVSHQLAIKEMINDNIKVTNDRSEKISQDVTDLKQSLEFTQDQMKKKKVR